MQIEIDVTSVRDEEALASIFYTLRLDVGEFLEERWDVEDNSRSNQIDTLRGNETGRE